MFDCLLAFFIISDSFLLLAVIGRFMAAAMVAAAAA
jgi:hypothetical protein